MAPVNLKSLSPQQQRTFFATVDNVLSDNDGVLSFFGKLLPGARDCITKFRTAGERVKVITNNTAMGSKLLSGLFHQQEFEYPPEDIITSTMAISKYLKDINFDGKLWVMALELSQLEYINANCIYINYFSLDTDIGFAKKMGFKQLLMLKGVTNLEDIKACDESFKPDYYLSSIDVLNSILSRNQIL